MQHLTTKQVSRDPESASMNEYLKKMYPPRDVEVAPSPENETSEDHDMIEPQEPPTMNMS